MTVTHPIHAGAEGGPRDDPAKFLRSVADGIERGAIPSRIFNDDKVRELELERVFARCWNFVGHESEIASPGDYVLRTIGEDRYILVRDEQGVVRVLLNNCSHRGSPICKEEMGNTSHFRCPYHSWVYKNSGEWNGAPMRRRAYRHLDADEWGLRAAPHVESVHGLVFASLNPDAQPLDDYLGGMRWYLDTIFGLNEQGMKVIGEPQRWKVRANWKSAAENFMADAYHVPSLHRSGEEVGVFPDIDLAGGAGSSRHLFFDEGHGMILNAGYLPPPWHKSGFPPEVASTFQLDRLAPDQQDFVESYALTAATIFPNLGIVRVPASPYPGAMPVVFTYLRLWQPVGTDSIINWNWTLGWNTAPDVFNDDSYVAALAMHGPAGIFEQDDTVVWAGAPLAGRSMLGRSGDLDFNYQMGLGDMSDYAEDPDWRWPGRATTGVLGEAPHRSFYRRWLREVTTP